jgi:DNA-binding LytR/AlgR family response regulator
MSQGITYRRHTNNLIKFFRDMSTILLKTGRGTFNIVNTADIVFVERLKARSRVFLADKDLRVNIPFIDLCAQLDDRFEQCHRKFLVNLDCIKKFTNRNILLNTDVSIPMGMQFKNQFTEKLMCHISNQSVRKSI